MVKANKRLLRIISLITTAVLALSQPLSVLAIDIPTPPTPPPAPEADLPETSDSSDTPDVPEAPEAPKAPSAPTPPPNPLVTPQPETSTDPKTEDPSDPSTLPKKSPSPDSSSTQTNSPDSPAPNSTDATSSDTSSGDSVESGTNTGSQEASSTNDPEIITGDADSSAQITNTGNTNQSVTESDSDPSISIVNQDNGSGSDNSGSVTVVDTDNTTQNNSATIANNLHVDSQTGGNEANKNMGDTSIQTGDANVSGTIVNSVNTNLDGVAISEFNIADDHVGDIVLDFAANCISGCAAVDANLENTGNGADSANTANLLIVDGDATFQTNEADVENNLVLIADSGGNEANKNTGGDVSIQTGDANVSANVMNLVNNNFAGNVYYGVVNLYGELVGDIIFPEEMLTGTASLSNSGNGADSTNTANLTQVDNDVAFQTNDATINNSLIVDANTGGNEANKNTTGSSTIQTGDTSVNTQVLNVANTNLNGENMWIVLINQAGQWIGQILGAPAGALFAGSENADFQVDENGQITVSNTGNGAGSDNQASLTQVGSDTLVQTNTANIDNNLTLVADTGHNSTNKNTNGNSSIQTGDANIIANLVNFVNNNISGTGKLFITVVNVFDSWTGNFITPGYHSDDSASQQAGRQSDTQDQELAIGGPVLESEASGETLFDDSSIDSQDDPDLISSNLPQKPVVAPLATQSSPSTNQLAQVAGIADNTSTPETTNQSSSPTAPLPNLPTSPQNIIHINLAWLLGLIPASIVYILRKKFLPLA